MKTEQIGAPGSGANALDPKRTRTSESGIAAWDGSRARDGEAAGTITGVESTGVGSMRAGGTAARADADRTTSDGGTERGAVRSERGSGLPLEEADEAAVSFARERERALARLDHTASVVRLRRALMVGFPIWVSSILLDLLVTYVSGEGSFELALALRAFASVIVLGTMWRLWRPPDPSVAALWFYDILIFTVASASVSVLSLSFRGIESPYGPSVCLVMLARGATTLARWQHGAWLFAAPGLAYPITVLVAAQFDPLVASQLRRPASLVNLYIVLFMIVVSWMMLVLGGHFAWRLRREAIETRNIGRYKLLRRLGGGGGGDVWAAFDTLLRQRVALKTVAGHRPGSQALARLEREVRALSELTHPNTVRIFDYGTTDDGLYYYAMELLEGENLSELVAREGPLSSARLARIACQMLQALGEAHAKGIVHRDIKPENVFVARAPGSGKAASGKAASGKAGSGKGHANESEASKGEVVKLLDFGIAHTSGDPKLTRTGFVAGTPAFMAPETIMGGPADVRSDVYSFGATAYFALTGHLPFGDEEPMALFAAHVSRPARPISSLAPQPVAPELERVVERCMAKDPADRYASTQALLEALNALDA